MTDADGHAVVFAGPDHAVGILHTGGERLFAHDRLHARVGAVHDHVGVAVVPAGHSQDVQVCLCQHLFVVGIRTGIRPSRSPLLPELLPQLRDQITVAHQLDTIHQV